MEINTCESCDMTTELAFIQALTVIFWDFGMNALTIAFYMFSGNASILQSVAT